MYKALSAIWQPAIEAGVFVGQHNFGDIVRAYNSDIHLDKQFSSGLKTSASFWELWADYKKHYVFFDQETPLNRMIVQFIGHEYQIRDMIL